MYRSVIFFLGISLELNCWIHLSASAQETLSKSSKIRDLLLNEIQRSRLLHSEISHSFNETEKELLSQDDFDKLNKRVEKRYLNWDKNQIVSTTKDDVYVNYFKPHSKSARVNVNENYLGFTLYKVNDQEVEPNTGIFHFVRSSDSERLRSRCQGRTLHAGAYFFIYNRCPENDNNLVASGYCHWRGGELNFNSGTFNSIQSYADKTYYANNVRRMNDIEKTYFQNCFNQWKDEGYQLSFICTVSSSFYVSSTISYSENNTAVSNVYNGTCYDCDQICNRSTRTILSSVSVALCIIFGTLL